MTATPDETRPEGIFGDARDDFPELGENRVAQEIHFTRIFTAILSGLLARMGDDYKSREDEEMAIRRLTWRAFRARRNRDRNPFRPEIFRPAIHRR